MGDPRRSQFPIDTVMALLLSLATMPMALALSKGDFFHSVSIYDKLWFAFFVGYIGATAGSVLLTGLVHLEINQHGPRCRHDKLLVWITYATIAASFFSMHILRIVFEPTFVYLRSLL